MLRKLNKVGYGDVVGHDEAQGLLKVVQYQSNISSPGEEMHFLFPLEQTQRGAFPPLRYIP